MLSFRHLQRWRVDPNGGRERRGLRNDTNEEFRVGSVDAGGRFRVIDWGDSSIAHPFFSLVVTFRFLEEVNHLIPGDPWFRRLRDAYLEPWGSGLEETFEIAFRVGCFAHAIAWTRQRDALPPEARPDFDTAFSIVLRRAVAQMRD